MITYICRNKDIKTGEDLPCTNTVCKTSICPSCGQRADAGSQIYWCKSCKTPIYEEVCPICNKKGKKLATDLRPVFPEERLLLELILGTPYAFLEKDRSAHVRGIAENHQGICKRDNGIGGQVYEI